MELVGKTGSNAGRLGELELAIMDYIWDQNRTITVPEVHEHLTAKRRLAYTSTMTVMSRLHDKGLLGRSQQRKPYSYWPAISREDYSADLMIGVLSEYGDRKAALARFVELVDQQDKDLLAQLIIDARKRRA